MQNNKNHKKFNPLQHFIIMPFTMILFIIFIKAVFNKETIESCWFVLLILDVFLIALLLRIYATANQDRIIRLEMRQKYFELTGKSFEKEEKHLSKGQIIALRFASDEELLTLIKRAKEENLKSSEIKSTIKNWKADHHRV